MSKIDTPNTPQNNHHLPQWLMLALSVLYTISPIDIIPDVPVVGWVDDASLLLYSALNLSEAYLKGQNPVLAKILKLFKWGVIILGIIAVLLILLLGAVIIKLFTT